MDTKVIRITPAIASDWLKRNVSNRPLRPSVVEGMKAALERGEYRTTHQGVAFDKDGNLLDGQHRLTAISQMPASFGIEMLVTKGLDREAFGVIDIGLKRSMGDVLRVPQGLAAVARFMAMIVETKKAGLSPQQLVPYISAIEDSYARLTDYCPMCTKTWSSASIRSAAILQMMSGGSVDYILLTYHALNHSDFDSMSRVAKALYRQQSSGLVRGSGGIDSFARAFKAFDSQRAAIDKIQINDHAAFTAEARDLILANVIGQKKAAPSGAAKKVNAADSTRRSRLLAFD